MLAMFSFAVPLLDSVATSVAFAPEAVTPAPKARVPERPAIGAGAAAVPVN